MRYPVCSHRTLCTLLLAASAVLVGCASGGATGWADFEVPVDLAGAMVAQTGGPRRVEVEVTDIRRHPELERTALGLSMGRIVVKPSEVELIQALVEAVADEAAARANAADGAQVLCGIEAFDITTPSTPLYWDITTRVQLVLRVRGEDRRVAGLATERTYIWPSREIIERSTTRALRQAGAEAGHVLEELFVQGR